MTERNSGNDLFWTAARYVWGELAPDEAAAFEERLADDEAACLAVAEAVCLTVHIQATTAGRAVGHCLPVALQSQRSQRRWAPAWLTVATLAIATAGFAIRHAALPTLADPASTELLVLWTDGVEFPDGESFDDLDSEPELLDESLSAPGWMVQAVQLADDAGGGK